MFEGCDIEYEGEGEEDACVGRDRYRRDSTDEDSDCESAASSDIFWGVVSRV